MLRSVTGKQREDTQEMLRSRTRQSMGVRRPLALSELARRFGRGASTLCESLEHYRRINRALFDEPLDL